MHGEPAGGAASPGAAWGGSSRPAPALPSPTRRRRRRRGGEEESQRSGGDFHFRAERRRWPWGCWPAFLLSLPLQGRLKRRQRGPEAPSSRLKSRPAAPRRRGQSGPPFCRARRPLSSLATGWGVGGRSWGYGGLAHKAVAEAVGPPPVLETPRRQESCSRSLRLSRPRCPESPRHVLRPSLRFPRAECE